MYIMVASVNQSYELINSPQPSNLIGFIKWSYYISPLGYFFDYELHKRTRELTSLLWENS